MAEAKVRHALDELEGFEIGLPYFDGDGLCRLGYVTAGRQMLERGRGVVLPCYFLAKITPAFR